MEDIYVGIDLGTTTTLACFFRNGKQKFAKFPLTKQILPSVIYCSSDGEISVGQRAKNMLAMDPKNGVRSSKTWMGDQKKQWILGGKAFTPTDVAAEILKAVRAAVVKGTKCSDDAVIHTVITVPAYFTANQRDETKQAGQRAGFDVLQIITEPMAAAVAAGCELGLNQKVLVADLGGGTFDLSVLQPDESLGLIFGFGGSTLDLSLLRLIPGDELEVEEVAAAGLDYGGLYIDRALYEEVLKVRYAKDVKDILAANPRGEEELLDLVAKMKEDLFDPDGGENEVTDIYVGKKTGKPYEFTITGDDVTQVLENAGIRDKIEGMLDDLLDEAGDDLTWIRPFGGTSLIPYFQNLLRDYAGEDVFDPEDYEFDDMYGAIADGAAQYGKVCDSDSPVQIENSLPYSLGLKLNDTFAPCLERGSLPGFVTPYRSLLQKDLEKCNYVLPVYQCFATAHLFRDPVFIGKVGLEKAEYASYGDLLYKMKNDGQGNIHLLIYRFDDAEKATVLLADKQVEIGDE